MHDNKLKYFRMEYALRIFMCVSILVLFEFSCRPGIWIRQDRFVPAEMGNEKTYDGASIFINLYNEAWDTTIFYYKDSSGWIFYEGAPTLAQFFQDCIQKSLEKLGIAVYLDEPPKNVPRVEISLLSLTDAKFRFRVKVLKERLLFNKEFEVAGPPRTSTDNKYLEERAYIMVNKMIEVIVHDKDFEQAVLHSTVAR